MNTILWSITVISQLICLYKALNEDEPELILFYRNCVLAFGIYGICCFHVSTIEDFDINLEIWSLID